MEGKRVQNPMVRIKPDIIERVDAYGETLADITRLPVTRTAAVERLLLEALDKIEYPAAPEVPPAPAVNLDELGEWLLKQRGEQDARCEAAGREAERARKGSDAQKDLYLQANRAYGAARAFEEALQHLNRLRFPARKGAA